MAVQYLEHFLVQTEDFDATVQWYERVIGLRRGPTPNFGFPVQWLYADDRDVLHVTHGGRKATENRKVYLGQQSEATQGSGVIDHVGFRCSGLRDTLAELRRQDVSFTQRQVNDQGLYQLFLFDPNGVKVELNFPVAEAVGLVAEVNAQTFGYQHVD